MVNSLQTYYMYMLYVFYTLVVTKLSDRIMNLYIANACNQCTCMTEQYLKQMLNCMLHNLYSMDVMTVCYMCRPTRVQ